jgi:competence protein ComEC
MEVYFWDVGQGDSTLIRFPNGTTMLIDCNIIDDGWLDKLDDLLPENDDEKKVLDYLVITHPHEDHIRGIGKIKDRYVIQNIWESGHRLYIEKTEQQNYPHYYDMLDLIQKVKRNSGTHKQLIAGQKIGVSDEPDVKFDISCPTKTYLEDSKPSERDIHEQCIVLRIEYMNRSIVFTGDSSMEAWKNYIKSSLKSTILHVSHHGSYTFFKANQADEAYVDSIQTISPEISIISVGENNKHGHPDSDALALYKEKTYNKQVYMTKDHGTLFVIIDKDGNYRIETESMKKSINKPYVASVAITASPSPKENGFYDKQVKINFSAKMTKLPSDQKVKSYKWIVQNNAIEDDAHHDWYIGQEDSYSKYDNMTAYKGKHILLCEVRNHRDRIIASDCLEVNVE